MRLVTGKRYRSDEELAEGQFTAVALFHYVLDFWTDDLDQVVANELLRIVEPSAIDLAGLCLPTRNKGESHASSTSRGQTQTHGSGETRGQHEQNVPIHEMFKEVSKITDESFEEFAIKWG